MDSPLSPTKSPSQGRFNNIFVNQHGSEDEVDPARSASTTQQNQARQDNRAAPPENFSAEVVSSEDESEDEVTIDKQVSNMNVQELITYLVSLGCIQETLDAVRDDEVAGKEFAKAALSPDGSVFLRADLGIEKRITRVKIITRCEEEACLSSSVERAPDMTRVSSDMSSFRYQASKTFCAEFPGKGKAGLPAQRDLKDYGIKVNAELSALSHKISSAAEVIYADPRVDLRAIKLNEKERYLDMTWGITILKSANAEVMSFLRRKENSQIDNRVSGMKISAEEWETCNPM